METRTVNLKGILTELDIFFIGSSNEVHLVAFKQHPDFNSFKGRMNFVRVPYLVKWEDEAKIYFEQIDTLKDRTNFEPHAIETIVLFSIMSRIRSSQEKNYKNKRLGKLVSSLSPLEKVLFITHSTQLPERFESEEKQILIKNKEEILKEFDNDGLYEGKFGVSPRVIKQIIYELANDYKNVTFIEVLDYLQEFIERKADFDFLNIPPQGDYNNPPKFLESLKSHCLDIFDSEVRESLGLVDNRSYEKYIEKYIQQITSLIKNEKVKNVVTGKYEESDKYLITEFESNIGLKENVDKFRSMTISKLGAYSLDHPGKKIVYTEVFPDVVKALKASFIVEQRKKLTRISKNLMFYIKETESSGQNESIGLSKDERNEITEILNTMQNQLGYSKNGALSLFKYLIEERY